MKKVVEYKPYEVNEELSDYRKDYDYGKTKEKLKLGREVIT